MYSVFLSTLSLRRATAAGKREAGTAGNFYPRSPCGERLDLRFRCSRGSRNFYPRSPCGERHCRRAAYPIGKGFLSTLSLRRATGERHSSSNSPGFLSTLSLRRATGGGQHCADCLPISIHALLAESDVHTKAHRAAYAVFLSTLSLRRATLHKPGLFFQQAVISIHALLAESDVSTRIDTDNNSDFYPRSPCGERPGGLSYNERRIDISIHALLAESDVMDTLILTDTMLFLSTLSLRRATAAPVYQRPFFPISIHALLAESDQDALDSAANYRNFYPRSPCGERLCTQTSSFRSQYFYPRSPCGERRMSFAASTSK